MATDSGPALRRLVPLLCTAGLWAGEPGPEPALGPQPRGVQIDATGARPAAARAGDGEGLGADVRALKSAMERVRAELARGGNGEQGRADEWRALGASQAPGERVTDGPRRGSQRLGSERLSVQRWQDGGADVNASIDAEAADTILREICLLVGRPTDGIPFSAGRRPVALHIKDLSWQDALDRMLGGLGLDWRDDGPGRRIEVVDPGATPPDAARLERLSRRALVLAARDRGSPTAAEAMWLMANHETVAGNHADAMRLYGEVVEAFESSKDRIAQGWVLRSMRGIADSMRALGQHQESRAVYRSVIARSDPADPELPGAWLGAAQAGRDLGRQRQDATAYDEAIDDLGAMITRYQGDPRQSGPVSLARLMAGELLFDAGRHREAEQQLQRYAADAGGDEAAGQRVQFALAECAFRLNRPDEALPRYERLVRAWRGGRADPAASPEIFPTAAYRVGLCHLRRSEPRYVHALFAFLRARQQFPRSDVDAEMLVAIARCYAELERDGESVAALWELLKAGALDDQRPGRLQLDQLVAELQGRLGEHAGPVRAKVLFYIAQASWRQALRDRKERTAAATQAVGYYERVVAENPPADLRHAAKLGLARASLLAGQEDRGVQVLRELLKDPVVGPRDREYAAQVLGQHLREKGRLREAIKAFKGEAE